MRKVAAVLSISVVLLLSGCAHKVSTLDDPIISIYLLDLTASGNAVAQLKGIEEELVSSITNSSLGNPFEELGQVYGPTLTRMYFVGTNAYSMENFKFQNLQNLYQLFQYLQENNNSSRQIKFWGILSREYGSYLKNNLSSTVVPTKSSCLAYFDLKFKDTWSFEAVRNKYSEYLCESALYSINSYYAMNNYVQEETLPGKQKASDVFGALSKIDQVTGAYRKEYPTAQVKLYLATDGDHRLWKEPGSNLKAQLSGGTDACEVAEKIRKDYEIKNLKQSDWLSVDTRGIAALITGSGDYPKRLNDFWQRCFFPNLDL